jgi:hypothetical protein
MVLQHAPSLVKSGGTLSISKRTCGVCIVCRSSMRTGCALCVARARVCLCVCSDTSAIP